jgi:outer membrane protein insertion porin family
VRFWRAVQRDDTVFFGAGWAQRIPGTNIPAAYLATPTLWLLQQFVPLTMGWSRDDRDSALAPNNGRTSA